mgnify:FL=1
MKLQDYKQAHKLQEQILKLKYELEVLKQSYEKPTSVRFGTEYNVTIPIAFSDYIYKEFVSNQIVFHAAQIHMLEKAFNEL